MTRKTKTVKATGAKMSPLLEESIRAINERMGKDTVVNLKRAAEIGLLTTDRLPSGIVALDYILHGGIPCRKLTEFYGKEGSGKTTAALHIAAGVLARGGRVLWIDAEHSMDSAWAALHGLDVTCDRFLLASPADGNAAGDIVFATLRTGALDLVVIDSLAALVPLVEIEKGMEQKGMAVQAIMMGHLMHLLFAGLNHREGPKANHAAILMINQVRTRPGVVYGDPEYAGGGNAKDHDVHVRVKFRRSTKLTVGEGKDKKVYGYTLAFCVVKNKISAELEPREVDLIKSEANPDYKTGELDNAGTLIGLAIARGVYKAHSQDRVETSSGKVWRRKELRHRLANDPAKYQKLYDKVMAR
jgi:recombination protein RecA